MAETTETQPTISLAPTNIPDLLRKARITLAINRHMLDTLTAVDTRLAMLARKHGGDVREAAVALRGLIAKAMDEDPDTLGTSKSQSQRKDDYMRGYGDGFRDAQGAVSTVPSTTNYGAICSLCGQTFLLSGPAHVCQVEAAS